MRVAFKVFSLAVAHSAVCERQGVHQTPLNFLSEARFVCDTKWLLRKVEHRNQNINRCTPLTTVSFATQPSFFNPAHSSTVFNLEVLEKRLVEPPVRTFLNLVFS